MLTRQFFQVLFLGALLFSFLGATIPGDYAPQITPWDKAGHFISFYVLAVLGAAAYPRRALVTIGAGLSAFGALIEMVQAIPALHRDCDFWDWVADTVAIIAAYVPVALTYLRERFKHSD